MRMKENPQLKNSNYWLSKNQSNKRLLSLNPEENVKESTTLNKIREEFKKNISKKEWTRHMTTIVVHMRIRRKRLLIINTVKSKM